mgnify:CR=1 FL=1
MWGWEGREGREDGSCGRPSQSVSHSLSGYSIGLTVSQSLSSAVTVFVNRTVSLSLRENRINHKKMEFEF